MHALLLIYLGLQIYDQTPAMSNDITQSQQEIVFTDLPKEVRVIVYENLLEAVESASRPQRNILREIHQNDPQMFDGAMRSYSRVARAHIEYLQKERQHLLCVLMCARLTACGIQPGHAFIPTTPHDRAWDTNALSIWIIQPPWTTMRKMQELQRITGEIMTEVTDYINQINQILRNLIFLKSFM